MHFVDVVSGPLEAEWVLWTVSSCLAHLYASGCAVTLGDLLGIKSSWPRPEKQSLFLSLIVAPSYHDSLYYLSMELAWQSDYNSKLVPSAIFTTMLGT